MGKLFENPWVVLIIIIVIVLLFAAPKLPGMARSLGQSMRIIKSEVKDMKNDGNADHMTTPSGPAAGTPFEAKIVNAAHPAGGQAQSGTPGTGDGTTMPGAGTRS